MATLEDFAKTKLQPPQGVLAALHALAKKPNAELDRLPKVKIDAASGHSYVGRVLEFELQGNAHRVLLATEGPSGTVAALSFLELVGPYQLTVLDAGDNMKLLRFGALPRWSEAAPPSALELKRAVERTRGRLQPAALALELDDRLTAATGAGAGVLADVLDEVPNRLEAVRSDDLGREALTSLKTVALRFAPGASLRVHRAGDRLELELDPDEGLPTREAFAGAIDAAL